MKYIKKQIEIEAILLEDSVDSITDIFEWVNDKNSHLYRRYMNSSIEKIVKDGGLYLETLEGEVLARFGDYIVKGINGELYPVNKEKFNNIYIHLKDNIYRKKPIEVDAFQLTNMKVDNNKLFVKTSDNKWLEASMGDYLVQESNYCYHPVKPDIFKKTYKEKQ